MTAPPPARPANSLLILDLSPRFLRFDDPTGGISSLRPLLSSRRIRRFGASFDRFPMQLQIRFPDLFGARVVDRGSGQGQRARSWASRRATRNCCTTTVMPRATIMISSISVLSRNRLMARSEVCVKMTKANVSKQQKDAQAWIKLRAKRTAAVATKPIKHGKKSGT